MAGASSPQAQHPAANPLHQPEDLYRAYLLTGLGAASPRHIETPNAPKVRAQLTKWTQG